MCILYNIIVSVKENPIIREQRTRVHRIVILNRASCTRV